MTTEQTQGQPETRTSEVRSDALLADAIAEDLFTDGFGNKYTRLVCEDADGKITGTGWSKPAIRARVLNYLRGNLSANAKHEGQA